MTNDNDKQEGLMKNKPDTSQNKNNDVVPEKTPEKNDSDTEPDEFIGPNADTDQPIDGKVINDAVLGGEGHAADIAFNQPTQDNKDTKDQPEKKDVEKEE